MEGGRNDPHAPPPPFLDGPPQDLLMAEVHAVEVPEGDDYPAQSTTSALPSLLVVPVHRQQLVPTHHPVTAVDPTPLHAPRRGIQTPGPPSETATPGRCADHLEWLYYAVM